MSANTNFKLAQAQLEAALANFDQAVAANHGHHLDQRTKVRESLCGVISASVKAACTGNALGHGTLDSKNLVLDITSGCAEASPDVIDATVGSIDARIAAMENARAVFHAAAGNIDKVLETMRAEAIEERTKLCALKSDKK